MQKSVSGVSRMRLEDVQTKSVEDVFKELESSLNGLTHQEAEKRLAKFGPNKIPEKKRSLFLKVLRCFWGPIPWMIETAAVISAVLHHWPEFYIIFILLLTNSLVQFFEEFQAGNAIRALKKNLALKSLVKRDGKWESVDAEQLIPGDIVRIKLGNIIPADGKLIEGNYINIDQSALTGESLPINKKGGDIVYSGSVVRQGEMIMIVTATGIETFFGKTVKLVGEAKSVSHFQKAILNIGNFLIVISLTLSVILIVAELIRGNSFLHILQYILLLLVASIPVALPTILSIAMAIGTLNLSAMKAIVSRLESIEEMAGIDVLCCDKTGTLTQNKLTLGDPIVFEGKEKQDAIFYGALASEMEDQDAIDASILCRVSDSQKLQSFKQVEFTPFDPVSKKSEAKIEDEEKNVFYVTKGAPQVILGLCHLEESIEKRVIDAIQELGRKGNRSLGVAKSIDKKQWEFMGLLPLFDPLREDTKDMIAKTQDHGIEIKMLTGDNIAIAREIARELNLSEEISIADELLKQELKELEEKIEKTTSFCQIFPEHKYSIVKNLQKRNHIIGMTGDGVNDAPALKQADVGIAVSGATDAAREAADLTLLAPGLGVIIKAIEEARRIFERMKSYAIYRICETIRIIFFIATSILVFNFYPITALMIILLALLNDLPIITIVYDRAFPSEKPIRWKMKNILSVASGLGFVGVISSFGLLLLAKFWFHFPIEQLQSFIFLKLSLAGHLTLFAARTRGAFFKKPYPAPLLLAAIIGTQALAVSIVGFGFFLTPVAWKYIAFLIGYTIGWLFILDGVKLLIYKRLNKA